jgi:predicted alpha-1,6-mannanase (GH76 family)
VQNTAEAFWAGRRTVSAREPLAGNGGRTIFSSHAELPAVSNYPAGAAVELSTQLQAWMVLEAAASIPAAGAPPRAASAPELPAAN